MIYQLFAIKSRKDKRKNLPCIFEKINDFCQTLPQNKPN